MASKSENIEQAFEVWRECGQDVSKTIRELKKRDFNVSRPTLSSWRDKYGWEDRAAREAVAEKEMSALSKPEMALFQLEEQRLRYEGYFKALKAGQIDTQATYAYTGIIKAMEDLRQKTLDYRIAVFSDFLEDITDYLLTEDQQAKDFLEKHFEGFAEHLRQKYGS
jgi:hypothetical protein